MSLLKRINRFLIVSTISASLILNASGASEKPYRMISNSEMKIALTFDDGPHCEYTEEILSILEELDVKATFFVIGCNCEYEPETVQKIIDSGHELGNHTYSHPSLRKISGEGLKSEILKTEKLLVDRFDYRPRLFRPPEGIYTSAVKKALSGLDYTPILWTVDTEDWRHRSAEQITDTVMENVSSGKIILCHDYISGKSNTPDALRMFIPMLREQGYKFVTVSELIMSRSGD